MKLQFCIKRLFFLFLFFDLAFSHVRKFNQLDFDKWLDEDNLLVVLFCSSISDQTCVREREKLSTLSNEMMNHKDIVFGYIDKESDAILVSRYDVQKFPVIKFFPYNKPAQNYFLNIRINELKTKIIEIKNEFFENVQKEKSTTKAASLTKKSPITEIDWLDITETVKDPEKHVILMLYDQDCFEPCKIMERVAKIFEEEPEIKFYKLSIENTGPLKNTLTFTKNPTLFWYPKHQKNGFIYGGQITLEIVVEYINDQAGLSRNYNGDLKSDAGRIPEIDQIIQEHIISILIKTKIDYVIFLVQSKSKGLPHPKKFIDYYLAILKEIKKGVDPDQVLIREQDFLNKRLNKGSNKNELDDWKKYYNIITAFVEFAAYRLQEDRALNSHEKDERIPKLEERSKAQLKQDPKWKTGWKHQSSHDEL